MAPRKATAAKKTTAKKAAPVKATKAAVRSKATAAKSAPAAEETTSTGGNGNSSTLNFLTELRALVDRHINAIGNGTVTDSGADDAAPAVADDTAEPPAAQTKEEREDELKAMTVRQLRSALLALTDDDGDQLFDEKEINAEKDKDVLIDGLLSVEFPDDDEESDEEEDEEDSEDEDEEEDDEEDEDEEEEDEDEEDEVTRESILKLSLAQAKKLAREQYDIESAKLKGLDKDAIANLILGEEDADEDEEDEEEEFWTYDELMDMPIASVRDVCTENGIKFTAAQGKNKDALAKLITEA